MYKIVTLLCIIYIFEKKSIFFFIIFGQKFKKKKLLICPNKIKKLMKFHQKVFIYKKKGILKKIIITIICKTQNKIPMKEILSLIK